MNEHQISNIRRRSSVFPRLLRLYVAVFARASSSCTKILGSPLYKVVQKKRFLVFLFPPTSEYLSVRTVGYTNADIRRTDSIQHVEPIAFEHLKVKRQIVATVDWRHAK